MEDKALVVGGEAGLPEITFSIEDIKKYICQGATDKELFMFVNIAKSYGLNPMKREIHFVKYGTSLANIIVGYEIYIKRAEATHLLDGWSVELGKDELGEKAIITIYRKDRSQPFVWTVYRSEFDTQQANWKKMPLFMLRKVAISQGFRLAFPEELGGMPYIPEELPTTGGTTSEQLPKGEPERSPITQPKAKTEAAKSEQLTVHGIIDDVKTHEGTTKAGKPFKKWGVIIGDATYGTFDTKIGETAENFKGCEVVVAYTNDGKFSTIDELVPVAAE
jgi:phage recombination protein Bet